MRNEPEAKAAATPKSSTPTAFAVSIATMPLRSACTDITEEGKRMTPLATR